MVTTLYTMCAGGSRAQDGAASRPGPDFAWTGAVDEQGMLGRLIFYQSWHTRRIHVQESCVDESCVDESCVDESCVDESCVDESCVDESCVDEI